MKKRLCLVIFICLFAPACGQSEETDQTIEAEQIADVVETAAQNPPTSEPTQTAAVTSAPTASATNTSTATFTPQPTATAVPTETPTATMTPTNTSTPTAIPTAVPTTGPTDVTPPPSNGGTSDEEDTRTAVFNAIQSQLQWLDILINTLETNFTVDPNSPWLETESYDNNVNCAAFIAAFDQIKAAPVIDVQTSPPDVQNAYNVYRAGLDGIVTNNDVIQWSMACQTAIQEGQENLIPGNLQRGILRQPMDEARSLLNQARSIIEEQ